MAKGCRDGGRLAEARSTRAVAKVVHHIDSICALSWGVYGGERRRAIWRSARNSRKCLLMKAEPLSQLTTKGLTGTADFIFAAMSDRIMERVWLAMSRVIVCAAMTRPYSEPASIAPQ
jgi:hypothetical protein